VLTCISKDASFEQVFSRQVEVVAKPGDILVGISTSGQSANIFEALNAARSRGVTTIGFTGEKGREPLETKCDYCLIVPSSDTARI
jgi:D-sedoheptulose 7-phosphate isomerase